MKKCSDCGLPYDDQFAFCPEDGAPLIPSLIPSGGAGPAIDQSPEQPTISEVINGTAPVLSNGRVKSGGPAYEASPSQVLRCPGCGTEYPRTFATCPIDGFKLTPAIIPSAPAFEASPAADIAESRGEDEADAPDSPHRTQPLVDPRPVDLSDEDPASDPVENESHRTGPLSYGPETGDLPGSTLGPAEKVERRTISIPFGRREAAPRNRASGFPRALVLVLVAVFALAGLYLLLKGGRADRQPAASLKTAQSENAEKAVEQSTFISTPEAARDYQEPVEEEATEGAADQEDAPGSEPRPNRPSDVQAPLARKSARHSETPTAPATLPERPSARTPARQAPSPEQIAAVRMAEVARQASDSRVNARLTRVRGRRTASGYRYDLTFTLNSQSQLSLYWDKLLISTRSASGTSNSMVVPFSHNLGATGSMTFTISVEMSGAAESDWQGRITCTSVGRDASGRLTRAAFSTSVAPG